ncbi:MAG: hypothetical protein WCO08_09020 [Actinomycetes bacterium]
MRKYSILISTILLVALGSISPSNLATAAPAVPFSSYICQGPEVVLLDNSNGGMVGNGGSAPSFSTNGKAYCLHGIETYHWNDGKGDTPGHLWLKRVSGPDGLPAQTSFFAALGSPGQNNVANANSYVNIPNDMKVIIDGTYLCEDTVKTSWASDAQSGGNGFCHVKAVLASPPTTAAAPTKNDSASSIPTPRISATGTTPKSQSVAPIYGGAAVVIAVALILIYRKMKLTPKSAYNPQEKLPILDPVVEPAEPKLQQYEPSALGKDGWMHGLLTPHPLMPFDGEPSFSIPGPISPMSDTAFVVEEKPSSEPELPKVEGDSEIVDGEYM